MSDEYNRSYSFSLGYLLGMTGKPYPFGAGESQKWETLFDGEVTTVPYEAAPGGTTVDCHRMKVSIESIDVTKVHKVTVGGYSLEGVPQSDGSTWHWFGNKSILYSNVENTGEDYLVSINTKSTSAPLQVYTRTPGTYKLKVERLVE